MRISADIERDYIVRGADAVAYGLVDMVIEKATSAKRLSQAIAAAG